MARLTFHTGDIFLLLNNEQSERHECGEVEFTSSMDEYVEEGGKKWPVLQICAQADQGEARAVFSITDYADIDALRRFCEMTLEHFKEGHLE